ncbi:hypothetical protein [Tessaracoccus flavescens]|uniref:hypothetical protein n=1 Tax=Tessaracoccus flavescens TaxID=399497 RepID=UPI0013747A8F|nr:hypothetical protein [Tessaracoccus flavescens]
MSNVVPEGWEANQGQPTEAREGDGPVLDEIVTVLSEFPQSCSSKFLRSRG